MSTKERSVRKTTPPEPITPDEPIESVPETPYEPPTGDGTSTPPDALEATEPDIEALKAFNKRVLAAFARFGVHDV